MSIFALGDTHLSFGTDKSMEVFDGWENYVSRLQENWEKLVQPEDTVVIPGDISWGMSLAQAKPDFAFLDALPGTKLIGKGNHDYWWTTASKMKAFFHEEGFSSLYILHNNAYVIGEYAVCGTRGWFFDDPAPEAEKILNREVGRLKCSIEAAKASGKEPLVFIHYPPLTNTQECTPIMNVLREEGIRRCYYAHLHGNSIHYAFRGEKDGIRFQLVSADALQFVPLQIERMPKNG